MKRLTKRPILAAPPRTFDKGSMTYLLKLTLLIVTVVCCTGCTTGYWMDRCRDAADIVTLSVGVGVGAKAQVGPVAPGLIYNEDFLGLNSGRPFARWSQTSQGYAADGSYLFWGMYFGYGPKERFKRYHTEHILGIPLRESVLDGFMGKRVKLEYPAPYFTQFEAVVGLGLSLRAGVNPGELIDFILGFAGIDIYSDDIGVRTKSEIEQTDEPPDNGPSS